MNLYELKNDIYIYDTPIGYGSFSILYKGFNYKLLKYIAVKQVNKIPDIKYMENEVNLMKTLSHPNVLKLYDVYLNKNKVSMMSNMNGRLYVLLLLRSRLRSRRDF